MTMRTSPEWEKMFGTIWESLLELCPETGGFMIDHENRTVLMDDNARNLIGAEHTPDYPEMIALLSTLVEHTEAGSKLAVKVVRYDDIMTVGLLKLNEVSVQKRRSVLPVCEISELTAEMSRNDSRNSLLALIQLCENGIEAPSDFRIFGALTAMMKRSPKDTLIAENTRERFWLYIPEFTDDRTEFLEMLLETVRNSASTDDFGEPMLNVSKLSFCAGISADVENAAQRMNTAEFSLFDALSKGSGSICLFDEERFEKKKSDYEKNRKFMRLVDENLFTYHFQPIVSAQNGEVLAYEILMRTDSSIGMYPLEILECAENAGRLYDIEWATMHNALGIINANPDVFRNKKLFVNSITAHMLSDEHWGQLEREFGGVMENMVMELTEQTEVDDDSLEIIKARLRRNGIRLAVDDYGTGYSNTSNLLRYSPNYVKIDRALITGIHSKPKMQKLVSGIIEFLHENGYEALAEGVETLDELRTMIRLGSDLIQGYYVCKPKPVMLQEVEESVCNDIITINKEYSLEIARMYHPKEGEIIDISKIVTEHYSSVFVDVENVTIEGTPDNMITATIIIKDGMKSRIVLRNFSAHSDKDDPIILIGADCDVELCIEGENSLVNRGIYVPMTSNLTISGYGKLDIHAEGNNSFAIGVDKEHSPGNILITMTGILHAFANGGNSIAIGGGKNVGGKAIQIRSGDIRINCTGENCVGIGIYDGRSVIDMSDCKCSITSNSASMVAIGSHSGSADVTMKNILIETTLSGLELCGIGVLSNGEGRIWFESGHYVGVGHGRVINCIGTRKGNISCTINSSNFDINCEGASVSGIGDMAGDGDVMIRNSVLNFDFHTNEGMGIGCRNGLLTTENIEDHILINQ